MLAEERGLQDDHKKAIIFPPLALLWIEIMSQVMYWEAE